MFIYEMHQHTAGCSACGIGDPADTVRALHRDGFAGMVLTNHFYHGNTGITRRQPWADFVRPYEEAYLEAKAEGERLGVDVLFGLEEGVGQGKEVLLYGITPAFVYAHPELRDAGLADISRLVREAGGLVFQAHPFRVRDYIPDPAATLPVELLDGMETDNACNGEVENRRAQLYARQHGLRCCAGSDAHTADFPDRFGIAVERRITTETELAAVLRSGAYTLYLGD